MHRLRFAIHTGCLLLTLPTGLANAGPPTLPLAPDERLAISVSEVFPGAGRAPIPTITVTTTRHFSCYDCGIAGTLTQRGRVLRVTLGGVACPDLCSLMMGPASYTARLGIGPGSYTLEVVLGKRTDRWSLALSGQGISLTPVTARFTAAPQPTTGRLPKDRLEVRCRWPFTTREPTVGPCERLWLALAQIAKPVLVARYPARARNGFFSFTGDERELASTVRPLLVKGLSVHLLLPRGTLLACQNGRCDRFLRQRIEPASPQLDLIR